MKQLAKINAQGKAARWLLVCVGALLTAGCREKPTTVNGLVTLDGKPLKMREGMRGTVVFQPTMADGTTLNGMIDTRGRYKLAAGSSMTVTPSVYWVTVSAVELVPASEDRPQVSGKRVTPAKYASATDSGFRVEVLPGENQVNLALTSNAEPPAAVHSEAEQAAAPTPEPADQTDESAADASAAARE